MDFTANALAACEMYDCEGNCTSKPSECTEIIIPSAAWPDCQSFFVFMLPCTPGHWLWVNDEWIPAPMDYDG